MSRATDTDTAFETERERLVFLRDEYPEGSFIHEYARRQLDSLEASNS